MYIEFVIADNFVLTWLAGAAAARLCHKRPSVWRMLTAATLGTVAAVFYPYLRLGFWAALSVKIALGILLCVIMYIKTPRFIASSLLFFGCTFAFGGANFALALMTGKNTGEAADICRRYPLFITLGVGAGIYLSVRYVVKKLRVPRARSPYEYCTDVEIFGATIRFSAFMDTGNTVFDAGTGMPVIITDEAVFSDKLGAAASFEFVKNIDRFRRMTVKTAAGETTVFLLRPQKITVYSDKRGHTIDAELGVCPHGINFSRGHELLLNPAAEVSECV